MQTWKTLPTCSMGEDPTVIVLDAFVVVDFRRYRAGEFDRLFGDIIAGRRFAGKDERARHEVIAARHFPAAVS